MSQLPKGWALTAVAETFSTLSGGTPSRSEPSLWGGNIPWLSSGDIKADVITDASETITPKALNESSAKLCRPGSAVIVVRSGILKHTLPVAILSREAAINQDIKCIDSQDDELNQWLVIALRANARALLTLNREGTTVQSVKSETLNSFLLPVPPIAEQRRIVAKLDALLARVRASQERLETVPKILKRFRQAVLAYACTGRLTADWRALHPLLTGVKYFSRLATIIFPVGRKEGSARWECGNRAAISKGGGKVGKPGVGFPTFPRTGISTGLGGYADFSSLAFLACSTR